MCSSFVLKFRTVGINFAPCHLISDRRLVLTSDIVLPWTEKNISARSPLHRGVTSSALSHNEIKHTTIYMRRIHVLCYIIRKTQAECVLFQRHYFHLAPRPTDINAEFVCLWNYGLPCCDISDTSAPSAHFLPRYLQVFNVRTHRVLHQRRPRKFLQGSFFWLMSRTWLTNLIQGHCWLVHVWTHK